MQCTYAILPTVSCLGLQFFPHYLINSTIKKKSVLWFSPQRCLEHFSFYEELHKIWSKMYTGLHVKCPLLLSDINDTQILLTDFQKILTYQISWKSIQWEPSCSTQTDRHDKANSHSPQLCKHAQKDYIYTETEWPVNSSAYYPQQKAVLSSTKIFKMQLLIKANCPYKVKACSSQTVLPMWQTVLQRCATGLQASIFFGFYPQRQSHHKNQMNSKTLHIYWKLDTHKKLTFCLFKHHVRVAGVVKVLLCTQLYSQHQVQVNGWLPAPITLWLGKSL
jgi:hypothetical protein